MAYLLLITGLTISAVAIYYSVVGLAAIFSAAVIPIIIMGTTLEVAKLVCATWLKANWSRAPTMLKSYMTVAVMVLMLITSMGIFGFLSKAHNDQNLVSGDVQSKLAIYDEKIKTARENIEADRKQLKQMDEAVDQVMARSTSEAGASRANSIRKTQQRDRAALAKSIEANQKLIATLNDEAAPIRAEIRKVEAEVGPIKYIAKFIYGDNPDENLLEKAVTWVIILIVIVFDPLAVIMLLAAQMTFQWRNHGHDVLAEEEEKTTTKPVFNEIPDWEDPAPSVELHGNPTYRGRSIKDVVNRIDEEIAAEEANAKLAELAPEEPEEFIPPVEEPVVEEEQPVEENKVTITHTADGIVIEDAAGKQEIHVDEEDPSASIERPGDYLNNDHTYVQNEEQRESNIWTKLANHTLTEDEYLKKLRDKKGE